MISKMLKANPIRFKHKDEFYSGANNYITTISITYTKVIKYNIISTNCIYKYT